VWSLRTSAQLGTLLQDAHELLLDLINSVSDLLEAEEKAKLDGGGSRCLSHPSVCLFRPPEGRQAFCPALSTKSVRSSRLHCAQLTLLM
jgi:hypothetical protein